MKSEEPDESADQKMKKIRERLEKLLEHERQKLKEYEDFLRNREKDQQ